MNPLAERHFRENPDSRYWYYNDNIRVPNPRFRRSKDYTPDPWPQKGQQR